jgi:chitinase
VQKLSAVPANYDIIAASVADATTTPGAVTFSLDTAGLNGYTVGQFNAGIKAKRAAGKNVIISVVPASTSGAGSGYVSPSIVNAALGCLASGTNCGTFKPAKTYPGIRGAMTWSTNWDATSGNAWSNAVAPHVHGLP